MDIIFAKTRHNYDSYCDFWRLVEASRYETCFVDQILFSRPAVYITTPWNGETDQLARSSRLNGWNHNQAKIAYWALERDVVDGVRSFQDEWAFAHQIWVSDKSFAKMDSRLEHVVLGGHPDIATAIKQPKQFDVSPLAYLWGRREAIVKALQSNNITIAPDAYGKFAQDDILPKSKLMLSMHQYDKAKIIAPLRFAVAASYGLPLLSEEVADSYPLINGLDFEMAKYEDLVTKTQEMLKDQSRLDYLAANLYAKLTNEYRFDNCVNAAVDRLLALYA